MASTIMIMIIDKLELILLVKVKLVVASFEPSSVTSSVDTGINCCRAFGNFDLNVSSLYDNVPGSYSRF